MRHWIFHPLIFYPLIAVVAAVVIVASLKPFAWQHEAAPQAGVIQDGAVILEGAAFDTPDGSPEQVFKVRRSTFGSPQSLSIAVLPGQPPPTPAETGVRILLARETAALLDDRPVILEVSYRALPINNADSLAVSLQGIGPAEWVTQPIVDAEGVLRFDLPPQFALDAIGLRALSGGADQNYGLEITRIRAIPVAAAAIAPAPAPPPSDQPPPDQPLSSESPPPN